jgi:hypothetical protein
MDWMPKQRMVRPSWERGFLIIINVAAVASVFLVGRFLLVLLVPIALVDFVYILKSNKGVPVPGAPMTVKKVTKISLLSLVIGLIVIFGIILWITLANTA